MAYTVIPSMSKGDDISAPWWNQYVKDNFAAGVPDVFTAKGDLLVAEGADTLGILSVGSDYKFLEADSTQTVGVKWSALPNTVARYKVSSGKTVNNTTTTIIDYDTSVYDPGTDVATGASWKYTAPATGKYFVAASLMFTASTSWYEGSNAQLQIYTDSALTCAINAPHKYVAASSGYRVYICGFTIVDVDQSSTIDIRAWQNSGANLTSDTNGDLSHVAIARVG